MTTLAAFATLLAASAGLNWFFLRQRSQMLAQIATLRTELAHLVEANRAREAHEARKAAAAADVRAKTAARLDQDPSAVEVRRTIGKIRRRRR